jgi:NAD+ diphosphatase
MPVSRNTEKGLDPLFPMSEITALGGAQVEAFLGLTPIGAPIFIALLPDEAVELRSDASDGFLDRRILVVRSIAMGGLVPQDQAAMLAAAKALMNWHARHRFCSNCGSPTEVAVAGWRRDCPVCKAIHFPRTDPVVIMLAVDGDACLLGRQPRFPKGMYSALAGFVEPGETIEAAVRREVREEAGVVCRAVQYFASQPWPFPASLMIGCFAEAESRKLEIDQVELEDARWFSRHEAIALVERRHPDSLTAPTPMAIAHHLLKRWAYNEVTFGQ